VIPDVSERQILDGQRPGTIPQRYAGGIGEDGAQDLRDFVNQGGTLVAFNNASMFAINQFKLPVANALAGVQREPVFLLGLPGGGACRGREKSPDRRSLPETIVMFERGPAFDTRPDFKARCLRDIRGSGRRSRAVILPVPTGSRARPPRSRPITAKGA